MVNARRKRRAGPKVEMMTFPAGHKAITDALVQNGGEPQSADVMDPRLLTTGASAVGRCLRQTTSPHPESQDVSQLGRCLCSKVDRTAVSAPSPVAEHCYAYSIETLCPTYDPNVTIHRSSKTTCLVSRRSNLDEKGYKRLHAPFARLHGVQVLRAVEIYLIGGNMRIAPEGYELTSNSRFSTSISSLGARSNCR
jgi:hypothetical protein